MSGTNAAFGAVSGVVVMRYGENALNVIERVKTKLKELEPSLPKGVEFVTTYDRSDLIHRAIETLRERVGDNIDVEIRDFLAIHGKEDEECPRCGGRISTIKAYEWVGSGGDNGSLQTLLTGVDCTVSAAGDTVCGRVNSDNQPSPWLFQSSGPHDPANTFLPGEFFVHQSACFSRQGDADLMNLLYERMGTGKWFFTKYVLLARLEKAGFAVRAAALAPSLEMSSADLGERYGLGPERMAAIGREIEGIFGNDLEVFTREKNEFRATLRYCIFTCEAV